MNIFSFLLAGFIWVSGQAQVVNLVFTSDLHYGIYRPHFRGRDGVASAIVNDAQVKAINALPAAGIKSIEAIVVTGDIANRAEPGIQQASASWKEFLHDYKDDVKTKTSKGTRTKLLLTPGNHDASNASAHSKIQHRDASSMTGMLQLMEGIHEDTASYNYHTEKVNYSRNINGVHLVFINIWPDSANRKWVEKDLLSVKKSTAVLLFTHDPPPGDPKHFSNPMLGRTSHDTIDFENLLEEKYKDTVPKSTDAEQAGLISLLKNHPNIKAWFHGHENFCEMYDYTGLHHELSIPVFRSDSPMKGEVSRQDETKLSFQFITIDAARKKLTVKQCLWNTERKEGQLIWGITRSIRL